MGAGGSLWKGSLNGNDWVVVNDKIKFKNNIIKVFYKTGGGRRLMAVNGNTVMYSDNDGATFTNSTGITFPISWGGNIVVSLTVLNDAAKTIYCLTRPWDDVTFSAKHYLYRSTNQGVSFTKIYTFTGGDETRLSLVNPYGTSAVYVLDNQTVAGKLKMYTVNGATVTPGNEFAIPESNTRCVLKGQFNGTALTLYALLNNRKVYRSTNEGASWALQGTLPDDSWDRLDVAFNDPEKVFAGGVNCFRSYNGGVSWSVVNQWFDYYTSIATKLHADIMEISQFQKLDGTPFTIINNHGGVAVSYDNLATTQNLSFYNLNNAQYYDVLTNPDAPNQVFAASQDQGLQQNTTATTPGPLNFTQTISGDYGYLCLTGLPKHLWTEYPGGKLSYYNDPLGGRSTTWNMPGTFIPNAGWMVPVVNTADAAENSVFVGGGNLSGGDGSYLTKLTEGFSTYHFITATQFPYNFRVNSNNGQAGITAIEASRKDAGRLYVAAEDGTFFYSNDNGANWTKSAAFSGPTPWFLYGSSIYSSRTF